MTVYHQRRLQRSGRPRSLSWYSEDSDEGHPRSLQDEIDNITSSLDTLEDNINSQQFLLTKEIEGQVQHVYDGVLQDIKGIRTKVKSISDLISETNGLKTAENCSQETTIVPKTVNERNAKVGHGELRSSRSLSNLDNRVDGLLHIHRNNFFSHASINSLSCKPSTSVKVQGHSSFHGDNKIYPYRTYKSKYLCKEDFQRPYVGKNQCNNHLIRSWSELEYPDEQVCMRGDIIDDWRVKVTPYLWDGWDTPGLDKHETLKQKARLSKLVEFKYDLLCVHNIHRHRHGCPPLIFSEILSCEAQQWADTLALLGYAQYSETPDRGENILVVDIEYELTGRQAADTWYREGRYFDYHDPKWQKDSSNFTQMMWKSSREIGVGIAKLQGQNTYIIVAQYYPAGNTNNPGDFWENVPPVSHFESSV